MGYFKNRRNKKEEALIAEKNKLLAGIEEFNKNQAWESCTAASNLYKLWKFYQYAWYNNWHNEEDLYPRVGEDKKYSCKILNRPCSIDNNCLKCAVAMKELGLKIIIKDE